MLNHIKYGCALLLALPVAALADTVTVTTHATGTTMVVDSTVSEALGITTPVVTTPDQLTRLPYELTFSTTYDTATAYMSEGYASGRHNLSVVDFKLGDQTWHYAGEMLGEAWLDRSEGGGEDAYISKVTGSFRGSYGPYLLSFQLRGAGPAGSFGPGNVLAPRTASEAAGLDGGLNIVWSLDREGPYLPNYIFDDNANPSTFSMQVSAVPEPASYALLGAGLAFLGVGRRARRRAA